MEKFLENLANSEKSLNLVEHLIYVTYPLVKDKNILKKTISELKKSQINLINAVLQFEYFNKRINLYKSSNANYLIFRKKCAKRYGLTEKENATISKILELAFEQKKSPVEIKKEEKLILFTSNSEVISINLSEIRELSSIIKGIIRKVKERIKKEYWRKV